MNWHLLGIAVFFYLFIAELAWFVHSLRYGDEKHSPGFLAGIATILFLLLTWNEW
jgi:hypothetical protein